MLQAELTGILSAMVGLLGLLCACLFLFGRLGGGPVVAFVFAGLVVGQLHGMAPDTARTVHRIADLGVVLLLFVIGLEMTPPRRHGLGRNAMVLGVPQIAVSAALIGGLMFLQSGLWQGSVVAGLAFSLSSTMVVLHLLEDRRELHTAWGKKTFAILLTQDLAALLFLVAISVMAGRGADNGSPWYWSILRPVAVLGGTIALGRFALPPLLAAATRHENEPAFICTIFLAVCATALASGQAGLSMALGTFVLGIMLSVSPFGSRVSEIVQPVKNVLLALFFMSIGASLNPNVSAAMWTLVLVNAVAILATKFAVMYALASLSGIVRRDATRMALALSQCGEFGFVLFAAAQAGELVTPELSALASVLIAISMVATPALMRLVAQPQRKDGRVRAAA